MTLLVHLVVMATHVPPPLADALARAAMVDAGSLCHSPGTAEERAEAGAGEGAASGNHGTVPAGTPGHFTYCPICLSLAGGKILGPSTAPVPLPPDLVVLAMPVPAVAVFGGEPPPLPFSARAPPASV